jgi:hypothetical protein
VPSLTPQTGTSRQGHDEPKTTFLSILHDAVSVPCCFMQIILTLRLLWFVRSCKNETWGKTGRCENLKQIWNILSKSQQRQNKPSSTGSEFESVILNESFSSTNEVPLTFKFTEHSTTTSTSTSRMTKV